jgi:hypothetical protein
MTSNDKDTQLFDGVVIFTHVVNCGSFTAAAEITGHSTSYINKKRALIKGGKLPAVRVFQIAIT